MIIAVTGGSGLLGRSVVELAVEQGHQVISIDRSAPDAERAGVRHVAADLTSYETLRAAVDGAEAMVHLAAYYNPRVAPDHVVHNNNVTASYNALLASAELGIDRVCLASSINAIGGVWSREPRYDYFPVDEEHPSYAEDPYSLSKWAAEQQGAAFARRYESMSIAGLRLHALRDRAVLADGIRDDPGRGRKDLWGYTPCRDAALACLASVVAPVGGYETFYVVGVGTTSDEPSMALRDRYYPNVPVTGELSGHASFFSNAKTLKLLGITVGASQADR